MSIPTQMSLVGFVASAPELHFTKKGDECCRLRVGVEQWRKEVDGSFTKLDPTFHDMVAFESTARETYALASGRVTPSSRAATYTSSRWSAATERVSSRRSSSPRRSGTTRTRLTTSSSADVTPSWNAL